LALLAAGQAAPAADAFQRALALQPEHPQLLVNLAQARLRLGQSGEAIECFQRAIQLQPRSAALRHRFAILLGNAERWDAAREMFMRALELAPTDAALRNDMGELLWRRQHRPEAIECFERAVQLDGGLAVAHYNLGNARREHGRLDEAEACYRRALAADPDLAAAMSNLAITLADQGRSDEATSWYQGAYKSKSHDARLGSQWLVSLQYLPGDSAGELCERHRQWYQRHHGSNHPSSAIQSSRHAPRAVRLADDRHGTDARLRVGLVSADFRAHPVGYFLSAILPHLDAARFELIGYADQLERDDYTRQLRGAASRWEEVHGDTDEQLATRIRADSLDLLIDLAGHTAGHRLPVFARRPAPVQATWLGYVGTTGVETMDYLISDRFHTPPGCDADYVERIVRLPGSYLCFAPPPLDIPVGPLPAGRTGPITLGCFNHPGKISGPTIQIWSDVLHAVPHSRLLLKYHGLDSQGARRRILDAFAQWGISPDRVGLEGPSSREELLRRYQNVDLALDTLPYSGGLTTCEALWMGVPVITLPGGTFASRHAASHLTNAGLGEFVAGSAEEYVRLAVQWTANLDRLAQLRATLRERLLASRLCDAPQFARDLERAWLEMAGEN
jgi:predicted O-linked N-acetylglucosamine transferase (SPINDLY family)